MAKTLGELDASIQATIDGDADFQKTLEGLSDEDKAAKVKERKTADIDAELARLDTEADEGKKAKELAGNYKTRAEKAEQLAKELKGANPTLSSEDVFVLVGAGVQQDDIQEIRDYAQLKGISIADALKAPLIKKSLEEKEGERKTAAAAQSGGARGASNATGEQLLEKAEQTGEVPEDTEGLQKLFRARRDRKLGKNRR